MEKLQCKTDNFSTMFSKHTLCLLLQKHVKTTENICCYKYDDYLIDVKVLQKIATYLWLQQKLIFVATMVSS